METITMLIIMIYDVDYYDNNLKNEVFDWIGKWS